MPVYSDVVNIMLSLYSFALFIRQRCSVLCCLPYLRQNNTSIVHCRMWKVAT